MTVGNLPARLDVHRIAPGQYDVIELAGYAIVEVSKNSQWAIVKDGRPVEVGGVREFSSLREAMGKLADARDAVLAARSARRAA